MKCQHCGNNLNIEDRFCPYCGEPNPYAVKHQKEMDRFEKDYRETKKDVLEQSSRFNRHTVRITILAVLVALIALTAFMIAKADDIRWWQEERKVASQADLHSARIDELMEERNYDGVYAYMNRNRLTYSSSLRKYDAVYETSTNYKMFYDNLLSLQAKKHDSEKYRYYTEAELIEQASTNIFRIYESMEVNEYNEEAYTGERMEYMEALRDRMEVMVSGYFGISLDEAKGMRTMSESRINVMLEDRYEEEN